MIIKTHFSRVTASPARLRVRPAMTQISLRGCAVWSESSLPAWRCFGSLATRRLHRLISLRCPPEDALGPWLPAECTGSSESSLPAWRCFGSLATRRVHRLIRVFAACLKMLWVLGYQQSALRRLLSDCAEAQADLSIRFARMQFCRKCCVPAHFTFRYAYKVSYILVNFIDIFWKLDNTIPSNFYFCVGKDRRGLEKKKTKKKKQAANFYFNFTRRWVVQYSCFDLFPVQNESTFSYQGYEILI